MCTKEKRIRPYRGLLSFRPGRQGRECAGECIRITCSREEHEVYAGMRVMVRRGRG